MSIGVSEGRQKHIMAVARKMYDIVAGSPEKFEISPEDAFLLGYLHDVGYEFAEKQTDHPSFGIASPASITGVRANSPAGFRRRSNEKPTLMYR